MSVYLTWWDGRTRQVERLATLEAAQQRQAELARRSSALPRRSFLPIRLWSEEAWLSREEAWTDRLPLGRPGRAALRSLLQAGDF